MRCVWVLGCPAEIRPFADEAAAREKKAGAEVATKDIFKQAFQELFRVPEEDVPEVVGVSCCSQFAVSRDAIRRRPREDYLEFLSWLVETPFDDGLSGRVLEYSWHSMSPHPAIVDILRV